MILRFVLAVYLLNLNAALAGETPVMIPPFDEWETWGDGEAWIGISGSVGDQMPVIGIEGNDLLNSYTESEGDGSTGGLLSPPIPLGQPWLNFLVGGGRLKDEVYIALEVDGVEVQRATGHDGEALRWHSWDLTLFQGKSGRIRIVDQATEGWGHILVDHLLMEEFPRMKENPNREIRDAMNALVRATEVLVDDPTRPVYHFHPPALWLNDPNGPIYVNGWYHLFYQHHPFGDLWGPMHWGHARSRDLVQWEHLPIALAPDTESGEGGVWSGSGTLLPDGSPILFYTSISRDQPANLYAEQHAAIPTDKDFTQWKRHSANPILVPEIHGEIKVEEWRDPFLFEEGGAHYMLLAARIIEGGETSSGVLLYKAKDNSLEEWDFLGIPFRRELEHHGIYECPNLLRLGDKWLLILSAPGWNVEYHVGDFDPKIPRFSVEHSGMVDHGAPYFYAPNTLLLGPRKQPVMWGWVRGFPEGRGWNGVLTIPRELSLNREGELLQTPLPELKNVRGSATDLLVQWKDENTAVSIPPSSELRLVGGIQSEGFAKFILREEHSDETLHIVLGNGESSQNGGTIHLEHEGEFELNIFLDRSVLEIFLNHRVVHTYVFKLEPRKTPKFSIYIVLGKTELSEATAWPMEAIMATLAPN